MNTQINFETSKNTFRTYTVVYLAGFHNSQFLDGFVFTSLKEAEDYCKDKVIYVKEVSFYSKDDAMNFIVNMAHGWINHIKSFDRNPLDFLHEIECEDFKNLVIEVINE